MSEPKRIGFIGIGNMGSLMTANLVRGGHQVMAYDIAPERARHVAEAHGARATESLAELAAHAEVVITMLPTGREVRDALLEAQGGARAVLGQRLFEVGGVGCGHAMKALNNFLAATSSAAGAEALAVGRQFGLDPAVMTDVLNASTGKSFNTENLIKQHVLSGKFATGF